MAPDVFSQFLPYCRLRLAEDPHLPAATLFDEVVELGYPGGYSTFTRALRRHQLRPLCTQCRGFGTAGGVSDAQRLDEAIRFDWLELPDPPAVWAGGNRAHVLVGSLTRSGRWRAVLAENADLPQLVEAMEQVMRRLGGTTEYWWFGSDSAEHFDTGNRMSPQFRHVARYYGARVQTRPDDEPEPATAGSINETIRAWWRGLPKDTALQHAQESLGRLAARMDATGTEALRALPSAPYPIWLCARRTVTDQGTVPFRGNFYGVPHHLAGAVVEVRRRLDQPFLSITTTAGAVIARYALAPAGAGRTVGEHSGAAIVLDRLPTNPASDRGGPGEIPPCRGRTPLPPSGEALAEAEALRGQSTAAAPCQVQTEQAVASERVPPQRDGGGGTAEGD
ncbi:transcriptional regulator [Streptomyces tateyamensis]|uniref:Transcriptional regulator n=2 Tax=Streptomyces tateyamensis TaxID=565073 RepID=A0A2V4MY54_9ACTN|nr:transcriptional regulator [Streptomyces tateyamensis]